MVYDFITIFRWRNVLARHSFLSFTFPRGWCITGIGEEVSLLGESAFASAKNARDLTRVRIRVHTCTYTRVNTCVREAVKSKRRAKVERARSGECPRRGWTHFWRTFDVSPSTIDRLVGCQLKFQEEEKEEEEERIARRKMAHAFRENTAFRSISREFVLVKERKGRIPSLF